MRTTITVSAADLARAYFGGRISGAARVDLSSEGRPVCWIEISKGTHRITLRGVTGSKRQPWHQTYPAVGAPIDD